MMSQATDSSLHNSSSPVSAKDGRTRTPQPRCASSKASLPTVSAEDAVAAVSTSEEKEQAQEKAHNVAQDEDDSLILALEKLRQVHGADAFQNACQALMGGLVSSSTTANTSADWETASVASDTSSSSSTCLDGTMSTSSPSPLLPPVKMPANRKEARQLIREGRSLLKQSAKEKACHIKIAQGVMEASFDPEFVMSDKGIITAVNRAAVDLFGFEKKDLLGQNLYTHALLQTQNEASAQRSFEAFVKYHLNQRREVVSTAKDGTTVPMELGLTEIRTPGGGKVYCVFMHDLTRRKQSEANRERAETIAKGVMEASFDPEFTMTADGMIQTANHAAEDLFGYTKNELEGQPVTKLLKNISDNNLEFFIAHHLGMRVEEVVTSKEGRSVPVELGLTELKADNVDDNDNDTDTDNRLFCLLMHDLTRIKKSDAETRKRARIAEAVAEASVDPEFTMCDDGQIQTANRAAETFFGWTKEEMIGKNICFLLPWVDQGHAAQFDDFIEGHLGKRKDQVAVKKGGKKADVELGLMGIETGDGELMFYVSMHDLATRRKRKTYNTNSDDADDAVQRKRARIAEGVMEASFDPEFTMTLSGEIIMANHAAEDLFGYSEKDLVGKNIDFLLTWVKDLDKFVEQHIGELREKVATKKDGTEVPIELGLSKIETEEEELFCLFIHDLTQRKKNDAVERKKQKIAEGVLEASFDPEFTMSATGEIASANHAAEELFGWPKSHLVGKTISFLLPWAQDLEKFVQDHVGQRKEEFAKKKDGSDVYIELGLTTINTGEEDDEALYCLFMHDLTRRKKNEAEKIRRQKITEGIMEASFDPEFTINGNGTIQTVNHAAEELFGWEQGELIGKHVAVLLKCLTKEQFDAFAKENLQKRREGTGKKKDGSDVPIELCLTEISAAGEEKLFCLFIHDLTRRKNNEDEKLRRRKIAEGVMEASFDPEYTFTCEGIFLTANHAAEELFGWGKEDIVGNSVSMLFGSSEDWKLDVFLERYLGRRQESVAITKIGNEIPVELGLTEIKTVEDERIFCLFIHDLTRRRKNQEIIARKQRITEGIIEASFDPMIAIDDSGSIRIVNKAACRQLGWTREELLEGYISMILFTEHAKKPYHFLKHYTKTWIKNAVGSQREMEARRRDGETFPITLGLSEVDCQGSDHLYVAFIRDLSDQKKLIETEIEKAQAESLLLNMLPEDIADRLKADPSHIAEKFASTTILFADIVGFTKLSSLLSPVQTVKMLNLLFCKFDEMLDKYGLNKVKTIGDCYMATSVPGSANQAESCACMCRYAFDILAAVALYNKENPGLNVQLRIGINTGPVVAGVVGTKRFLYDLWGDAVNMASRMESTGLPDRIQVSKEVIRLIESLPCKDPPGLHKISPTEENEFETESRGKILIKGKGEIETFWLKSRRGAPRPRRLQSRRASCPMIKGWL